MKFNKILLAGAVLAIASIGFAQDQGRRGGGERQGQGQGRMMGGMQGMQNNQMFLLMREDVREDLKLSADQQARLTELVQNRMQGMMGRGGQGQGGQGQRGQGGQGQRGQGGQGQRGQGGQMGEEMQRMQAELNREINAILTPEQQTRLRQISIQLQGPRAVLNPEVGSQLNLTEAQQTRIRELMQRHREANQSVMQRVRSGEIEMQQAMETTRRNDEALGAEIAKVLTPEQAAKLKAMEGSKFDARDQGRGFGIGRGIGR
jgi:Spy/CpxP family protein refolding chaperone